MFRSSMFEAWSKSTSITNQVSGSSHRFVSDQAGSLILPVALLAAAGVVGILVLSPANIEERRITVATMDRACEVAASAIAGRMNSSHSRLHVYTPNFVDALGKALNAGDVRAGAVLRSTYKGLPAATNPNDALPDGVTLTANLLGVDDWKTFVERDTVNGLGLKAPIGHGGELQLVPLKSYVHLDHDDEKYTNYDETITSGANTLKGFRRDFGVDIYKIKLTSQNPTINATIGAAGPENLDDDASVSVECYGADYYNLEFWGVRRGFEVLGLFGAGSSLYPQQITNLNQGAVGNSAYTEDRLCHSGSSSGTLRVLLYNRNLGLQRSASIGTMSGPKLAYTGRPYWCKQLHGGENFIDVANKGRRQHFDLKSESGLFEPFQFYRGIPTKAMNDDKYRHIGFLGKEDNGIISEGKIHSDFKRGDTPIWNGGRIKSGPNVGEWEHSAWPGIVTQESINAAKLAGNTHTLKKDTSFTDVFNREDILTLPYKFAATFEPGLPGYIYCSNGQVSYKVTAASLKAYMKAHGYVAWRTSESFAKRILNGEAEGFDVSGIVNTSGGASGLELLPYRGGQLFTDIFDSTTPSKVSSNENFIPIAEVGSNAIESVKFGTTEGDKINIYERLYTGRAVGQYNVDAPIKMENKHGALPKWQFVSHYGGRLGLGYHGGSDQWDAAHFTPAIFYKTQVAAKEEWRRDYDSGRTIIAGHYARIQEAWRGMKGDFDYVAPEEWGFRQNRHKGASWWTNWGHFYPGEANKPGEHTDAIRSHPLALYGELYEDLGWQRNHDSTPTIESSDEVTKYPLNEQNSSAWFNNCHNITTVWTMSWRVCDVHLYSDPRGHAAWIWVALQDVAWWRTEDHGLSDGDGYAAKALSAGNQRDENYGALPTVQINPGGNDAGCLATLGGGVRVTGVGSGAYTVAGSG